MGTIFFFPGRFPPWFSVFLTRGRVGSGRLSFRTGSFAVVPPLGLAAPSPAFHVRLYLLKALCPLPFPFFFLFLVTSSQVLGEMICERHLFCHPRRSPIGRLASTLLFLPPPLCADSFCPLYTTFLMPPSVFPLTVRNVHPLSSRLLLP